MKVKELIEQLEKLDQEKQVWIFYDYPYAVLAPTIDGTADDQDVNVFGSKGVQKGDYYINAW